VTGADGARPPLSTSARPPVRGAVAARLRTLADRLAPIGSAPPRRSPGALIRVGGLWWHRSEVFVRLAAVEETATDARLPP
jgi:hypothetical protein